MRGGHRRVFLSHSSELREFPRDGSFVAAAEAATLRAGFVATDMAYFAARDQEPAEYCRRVVSEADVYVGIVGFRYGSPVRDNPDVSYTELEFATATALSLPRLIFILDERAVVQLPAEQIIDLEYGQRQAAFRQRLRNEAGLIAAPVASPLELQSRLLQALVELDHADRGSTSVDRADAKGGSVAVPLGRLPVEVRGRDHLLHSLQERRTGLVVLAGMGGVGKSTVAAELARRVQGDRHVWWVSAADASNLTGGMISVARRLGATQLDLRALEAQAGDAPDRLWDLLEAASDGWLLVLDNADQPEILAARGAPVADGTGWVRAGRRGLVLVSSRDGDWSTWGSRAAIHRLQPLDATGAGKVLLDLAPNGGDQYHAEALGRRLGGLPLALHLAGLNVGSEIARWSTFTAYREALDGHPTPGEVLTADSAIEVAREQRAIVMKTWELSLDALAERGLPHGRALLRLLSCYAPGVSIPRFLLNPELFNAFWAAQAIESTRNPSPEQVQRSLAAQGLIEFLADEDGLVVHPVVADTNRAHLLAPAIDKDPEPLLVRQMAVTLVTKAVRALHTDRPSDWPRLRQLAPHILALLRTTMDHIDDVNAVALVDAAVDVAAGLASANTISIASNLMNAADAHARRLGDRHPAILNVRNQLAYQIGEQGRWAEAEAAYRAVLEARRQVLGPDDPDTLASQYSLAFAVARLGRWGEAEVALRAVFEAMERTLGAEHPSTLDARHYLYRVVADRGRWKDAEVAFRKILEAKQRVLGAEHPSTLTTRHYLGLVIDWQGRSGEADDLLRAVLEDRHRVLGAEHTSTLITRLALAHHRARAGRVAEAEEELRQILETRLRVDGPEDRHTLNARHELARLAGEQGRWPEAESVCREVLAIQRRVLGEDDHDTLRMRHELARAVAEQGRWAEAKTALQEILVDCRRVLGDDHPDTLGTLDVLVDAERKQSLAESDGVRLLNAAELRHELDQARRQTDFWWFKGGTGTYLRAMTLPQCIRVADRDRRRRLMIQVEIIDPTNDALCVRYARLRHARPDGTGEPWTRQRTRNEAYATILAGCWYLQRYPDVHLELALSARVSTFRWDLSSRSVIMTQEHSGPHGVFSAPSPQYDSYIRELEASFKQARPVPLGQAKSVTLSEVPVATEVRSLFSELALEPPDPLTDDDIADIVRRGLHARNPYP